LTTAHNDVRDWSNKYESVRRDADEGTSQLQILEKKLNGTRHELEESRTQQRLLDQSIVCHVMHVHHPIVLSPPHLSW
jgi:hypothetical protein